MHTHSKNRTGFDTSEWPLFISLSATRAQRHGERMTMTLFAAAPPYHHHHPLSHRHGFNLGASRFDLPGPSNRIHRAPPSKLNFSVSSTSASSSVVEDGLPPPPPSDSAPLQLDSAVEGGDVAPLRYLPALIVIVYARSVQMFGTELSFSIWYESGIWAPNQLLDLGWLVWVDLLSSWNCVAEFIFPYFISVLVGSFQRRIREWWLVHVRWRERVVAAAAWQWPAGGREVTRKRWCGGHCLLVVYEPGGGGNCSGSGNSAKGTAARGSIFIN